MSGNTTIRLVSGGTLQVRTGVLKGVGPIGPTGPTGATGPAPAITATATAISFGATPTVTVSGSGGTYNLAFGIPSSAPTFTATATQLAAGAAPTATVTGSNPYNIAIGVPAGLSAGGQGVGFQDMDYLSGLKLSAVPTSSATSSTSVTLNDAGGKAICALLLTYHSKGGDYALDNWRMTIGGTNYIISTTTLPNASTGVITLTAAATTTAGVAYQIYNTKVDSLSAAETLSASNKTADQGITVPAGSNKPFLPNLFKQMIQNLETRLVSRYASSTERSSKRSTREVGEITFLNDDTSVWVRSNQVVSGVTTASDVAIPQVRISTNDAPTTGTYPQGTLWLKV